MNRGRDVRYDVIRVISMLFVIAVHVNPKPFNSFPWFKGVFDDIIYTCNGMFFMLSGYFNLKKEFVTKEDYGKYYKSKLVTILLPYAVMTCLLYGYDYWQSGRAFSLRIYLEETINQFLALNSEQHLWFMYSLIGLVLSAPFLSKMLHAMKDWELKLLFFIAIGWNAVSFYLANDMGWNFHYGKWLLASWTIYFFLGYFQDRVIRQSEKKFWYLMGAVGFFVTVFWSCIFSVENHGGHDFAPAYLFFVIGLYTLLLERVKIPWEPVKRAVSFVAGHSFTVYLIHYLILQMIGDRFYVGNSAKIGFLLTYFCGFALSLLAAAVFDGIMKKALQEPLKKVFKI